MDSNNMYQQQPQQQSGLGIAGMIIGIIALLTSCIMIGGFVGIIGLILSIIGVAQKNKKSGLAVAGITLNAIAIIIMIIVAFAAASTTKKDEVKNVTDTNQVVSTQAPESSAPAESSVTPTESSVAVSEETPVEESSNVFNIGDTAEYKDVQISIIGYTENTGNDWGTPANGKIFVFPEIEIVNNSSEEINISSMMSFECYCDDYKTDYSSNAFMAISTDDSVGQLDGSIAPGKKMKGVLGMEVPSDWAEIEIYYKDNVWFDSNFSFIITK